MLIANEKRKGYIADLLPGHTSPHVDCPACDRTRVLMVQQVDLAELKFKDAAPIWMKSRQAYLKPKSNSMNEQYIASLDRFFGDLVLKDIHIGHLREYQAWRQLPTERIARMKNGKTKAIVTSANASCINHELSCMGQILRRASCWATLKDLYEPLPLPRWIPPRVLSEEEEDRFFRVAASNPSWMVAYLASSLTANTTASGCEIKGLRLKDIDINDGVLYIPSDSVKNEFRARVIPLNERALLQVRRLIEIAKEKGSVRPEHYLLPFRVKRGTYDPDRPATSWKTAFREARAAACLNWLRPHDLRHQAITKLLEQPNVSEETVKSIAGHVSKRILETYSHIRISAKRNALATITPKPVQPSRGMEMVKRSRA